MKFLITLAVAMIGPVMTKNTLTKAGEIIPESKTGARTKNS